MTERRGNSSEMNQHESYRSEQPRAAVSIRGKEFRHDSSRALSGRVSK
jgi:hypothetical protein